MRANHSLLRRTSTRSRSSTMPICSSHVSMFFSMASVVSIGRVLSLPEGSPTVAV